ncbi:UNVERIFIED_CONTAM: hypothetical protein GTU68_029654 [Idotea baltica]|nr:hypothetical protein [Idotea baltica]
MILMGFVGSAATGIGVDRTKMFSEITKVSFGCAAFFLILMFEYYLLPNQKAGLIIFSGLFGFFGIGAYPIGLEFAVEATYPIEESISTAFIFLSGELMG